MANELALFLILAHSPLHVGVGEGIGHINLPTAREKTTDYPYLPGSSIKGVLREQAERKHAAEDEDGARYGEDPVVQVFGPPTSRAGDARGGMAFSDARLLFLPVRSLLGGFALVTCPLILQRLARELKLCGRFTGKLAEALASPVLLENRSDALIPKDSSLRYPPASGSDADKGSGLSAVLLEDLSFRAAHSSDLDRLVEALQEWKLWDEAEQAAFTKRLVLISDTDFSFFVSMALEVRHRVKIDDQTGTAASSGPWLEEYVPAESVFFGLVQGRDTVLLGKPVQDKKQEQTKSPARDNLTVLKGLVDRNTLLRFGGKSSGGAGRAFFRLL
ncbi:MAG: type III-B CRISPR module RAMP protein Cmr4 [Myxococcota bacterium]